ncbi:unnamed protein product [Lathyrus oleraceus]
MGFIHYFTLFLFFFLSLCFPCTISRWLPPVEPHKVFISIKNDLPNNTLGSLTVSCGNDSHIELNVGGNYDYETMHKEKIVECSATWSDWSNAWVGYDFYDEPYYPGTYFSVREDGFYQSFPGTKFKFDTYWRPKQ